MEYERIHKVQSGIISPSKLRLKLIGVHNQRMKEESKSNSSRTSPSKLEDTEFLKNSLLDPCDYSEATMETSSITVLGESASSDSMHLDTASRENGHVGRTKAQQISRNDTGNLSTIHPMRNLEDENLDYDSNASSSSFEFHKGERSLHNHITRSLSRPMPSKWNDAEKWIMNRQSAQANHSKKVVLQSQATRPPVTNMGRVAPTDSDFDHKSVMRITDTKRVDLGQPVLQTGLEKFSFVPPENHVILGQANPHPQSKDLNEACHKDLEDTTDPPGVRSVSMRDMGTEMTPIPSQEPSRTASPLGATTPLRSPTSSIPSTPRGGAPAPTPTDPTTDNESQHQIQNGKKDFSEEELKLKTRREIVALGVQLGKMNIAEWASKDEKEKNISSVNNEEIDKIEYEKRAAAWEDAEKSKHAARYKREEIKIQAWESEQKAKLEAETRKIEAQVEQMRANAHAKMVKKLAMASQRSDEKRAAAESKKNRQLERTMVRAKNIRQTGRIPSTHFICCGWLS